MIFIKDHGIIIRLRGNKTTVSCQCRSSYDGHVRTRGGGEYFEPMTQKPGETIWQTYNKVENHWVEFKPEDRVSEV